MRTSQLLPGIVFLSALMIAGCSRADTDESAGPAHPVDASGAVGTSGGDATAGAFRPTDDASVTTAIEAKFFRDSSLKTRHIDVAAQGGLVTLRGTVASDNERAQARLLAWTTHGVQRVNDVLTIDPTIAGQAPMPPALDTQIEEAVRSRLQSGDGVFVSVTDGVVLLEGTVPTAETKQRAITVARQTQGVVQVVDRIQVAVEGPD